MQRFRLLIAAVLLAVLFALGLWLGFAVPRWLGFSSVPKTYNTATVLTQVQTLSELVTVKYVMEKVVIREVPAGNPIGRIVGSEDRVWLLAHGIVKAGIDFKRLKPEDLVVGGKSISIRLPPPQITDAYLDDKQTRVLDRTTGLFTTFDKELEQSARQIAVDDIRRAARTSGILKDAESRAQDQLRLFLLQAGFEKVQFLPQ